jgi:hypothetical protein
MPNDLHSGGVPVKKQSAFVCLGLAASAVFLLLDQACSLQNQVGPNVTCADLMCGKVNACEQGIIAQCSDGKTVIYRVCGSSNICGETWQMTGQYKCAEEATDCEGCRPDRSGCDMFATSSSTTGSTGAGTSSTGTGSGGGAGG